MARAGVGQTDEKPGAELGGDEPLADWERELLSGDAAPEAPAAAVEPEAPAAEPEAPAEESTEQA